MHAFNMYIYIHTSNVCTHRINVRSQTCYCNSHNQFHNKNHTTNAINYKKIYMYKIKGTTSTMINIH